ncbi:MAG: RidA family protein [Thermoproteota archaeon]|jgi:enamine deaminase RidA (YjgF/YER057c/UK114 family)|nr:RidA family protein [Thermoproteota archaeon]
MIEEKLSSLGISLPIPPEPAGSYLPVVLFGNLAFVAGQIPTEGKQVKFRGKVESVAMGQEAARLCTINALAQLKSSLGSLNGIKRVIKVTGFVNCDPSFTDHAKVLNGASDLLVAIFGEKGKHVRAAVGVTSLPLDSAVEIEFIVEV